MIANNKPPIDIEQWIDFIIAAAAHRSHDEGQKLFGEIIIRRYFEELPKEYSNDPIAKMYLDNILCSVSSAIRGFSVVRDTFQTQWDTLQAEKKREIARAERLDSFSPFKPDGYWKIAGTIIVGLGLLSTFLSGFQNYIGNLPWTIVGVIALVCLLLLFAMELFIDRLRNNRLSKAEKKYPNDLLVMWQEKTLEGYRKVCKQFLYLAIKIREEYYPDLTTLQGSHVFNKYSIPHIDCGINYGSDNNLAELDRYLTSILEQHFTFKVTKKE